jgi:uncharacterized protein YdaL
MLVGSVLQMAKSLEDPKAEAQIQAEFDLVKIFPGFATMSEVQQQTIVYGVKQKLSDKGASAVADLGGKVVQAKANWENLVAGKWTGDRVNSTGASENKKIAAAVKSILAEGVSLNSLMMKKLTKPETFTPEEETKLQELMAEAVRVNRGKK